MTKRYIKVWACAHNSAEVQEIAKSCNCSIAEAFLAWFRFQAWIDEVTVDGHFSSDGQTIDEAARLVGFTKALVDAKTLIVDNFEMRAFYLLPPGHKTSKARTKAAKENAAKAVEARAKSRNKSKRTSKGCGGNGKR